MTYFRKMRLLALTWVVLVIVRAALLLTSYRRLAPMLPSAHRAPSPALAGRVEAAVLRASRLVPGSTCLVEACAARVLLAIRGFGATMRVGVQTGPDGRLIAHAWLISEGNVILGSRVPSFEGFRRLVDFS